MSSAGLSADPTEYRSRLAEQTDQQLDAWTIELMRDLSIRAGVLLVLDRIRQATSLDDAGITKVFTAGGGAPATIGRTADGQLMVPAISLHFLVPGLRAQSDRAREQEDRLPGGRLPRGRLHLTKPPGAPRWSPSRPSGTERTRRRSAAACPTGDAKRPSKELAGRPPVLSAGSRTPDGHVGGTGDRRGVA